MRPQIRLHTKPRPLGFSLSRLSSAAAVCATLLAGVSGARAAILDWDPLGNQTNSGGLGAWDQLIGNLVWNDDNSAPDLAWVNANLDTARFGTAGGTVTLGEAISAGGLTFDASGYDITGASTLTLGGATPTVTVTNVTDTATITSTLAGTAGLTKSGNGTLVLAGNNAGLTGTVSVNQGILSITADNQFGAAANGIVIDNAATLRQALNGQVTLGASRTITIGAGGGTIDVVNTGPTGKLLLATAGQLVGGGVLTKTGNGTFQLSQANTGFTGTLVVNGGQVEAQNGTALGSTPPQVTIGGTGEFVVTNMTWVGPIVASGGGTISGNTGNSTFTGGITANGAFSAGLRDFQNLAQGRTLTLSGPISGAGALTAVAPTAGAGTLVLTGNNAGYSGNISIPALATVQIGARQALGTGGFTLNGGTLRLSSIASGSVASSGSNGLNGSYYNFGTSEGTVIGVITGVGGTPSQKFAVDQLYLSPRVFNRVDATINVPNSGSGTHPIIPVPGYTTSVGAAGSSNNGGMWKGLLNIVAGGSYTFTSASDDNSAVWIDGILVVNNDQIAGHGTPGPNPTGSITLGTGAHSIVVKFAQGAGGSAEQVSYNGLDTLGATVILGSTAGTVTTGSLAATDIGPVTVAASSTMDFTSDSTSATLSAGTATLTLTSPTVSNYTVTGATTFTGNPTFAPTTGSLTLAGAIGGTGNVTFAGPYLSTIQGNNTFTGTTTVTGGQLSLNTTAGTAIPGSLTLNAANANGLVANVKLLQSNQIADGSSVTVTQGVLDVGANSDTIANLTLNAAAQTNAIILGSGGVLTVTNAPTLTSGYMSAGLGGAYNLVKAGTGTVILAGSGTYTGGDECERRHPELARNQFARRGRRGE